MLCLSSKTCREVTNLIKRKNTPLLGRYLQTIFPSKRIEDYLSLWLTKRQPIFGWPEQLNHWATVWCHLKFGQNFAFLALGLPAFLAPCSNCFDTTWQRYLKKFSSICSASPEIIVVKVWDRQKDKVKNPLVDFFRMYILMKRNMLAKLFHL